MSTGKESLEREIYGQIRIYFECQAKGFRLGSKNSSSKIIVHMKEAPAMCLAIPIQCSHLFLEVSTLIMFILQEEKLRLRGVLENVSGCTSELGTQPDHSQGIVLYSRGWELVVPGLTVPSSCVLFHNAFKTFIFEMLPTVKYGEVSPQIVQISTCSAKLKALAAPGPYSCRNLPELLVITPV